MAITVYLVLLQMLEAIAEINGFTITNLIVAVTANALLLRFNWDSNSSLFEEVILVSATISVITDAVVFTTIAAGITIASVITAGLHFEKGLLLTLSEDQIMLELLMVAAQVLVY